MDERIVPPSVTPPARVCTTRVQSPGGILGCWRSSPRSILARLKISFVTEYSILVCTVTLNRCVILLTILSLSLSYCFQTRNEETRDIWEDASLTPTSTRGDHGIDVSHTHSLSNAMANDTRTRIPTQILTLSNYLTHVDTFVGSRRSRTFEIMSPTYTC